MKDPQKLAAVKGLEGIAFEKGDIIQPIHHDRGQLLRPGRAGTEVLQKEQMAALRTEFLYAEGRNAPVTVYCTCPSHCVMLAGALPLNSFTAILALSQ